MSGVRLVPYRLPQLLEAIRTDTCIHVVEGEKDVHALVSRGLVATCNQGGAGQWRTEYAKFFAGAKVVVVPDLDGPEKRFTGERHALAVCDSLKDVAGEVRIGRPRSGKDMSDHLAAGFQPDDLDWVTAGELRRVVSAPVRGGRVGRAPSAVPKLPLVFSRVIEVLERIGEVTRPTSPEGGYMATCPAHDDRTPSLSLRVGVERAVLLKCHAGCTTESVIERLIELGIARAELMAPATQAVSTTVRSLAGVRAEPVCWLWPKRIAYGKLTNFEGDPEQGKSLVTLDLGARATNGGVYPDGIRVDPAALLLFCIEDDFADTIVPRLEAAGADMQMCFTLHERRSGAGLILPYSLPDDAGFIAKAIDDVKAAGRTHVIVIVDPVSAFLSEKINSNNDASVRRAISPLAELARDTGAAIWLVRHLNKNSSEGNVAYRGGGSIGFFAAARHVFVFGRSRDDATQVIMAQSKNNLGPRDEPSLVFHVEAEDDERGITMLRVVWDGTSEVTASEVLSKPDAAPNSEKRDASKEMFAALFAERDEVPAKEVKAHGYELGISPSTVRRAAEAMGIAREPVKGAGGRVDHWVYRYPIVRFANEVTS